MPRNSTGGGPSNITMSSVWWARTASIPRERTARAHSPIKPRILISSDTCAVTIALRGHPYRCPKDGSDGVEPTPSEGLPVHDFVRAHSTGSAAGRLLFFLRLIPQRVHLFQRRLFQGASLRDQRALDVGKAFLEFRVSAAQ